MSALDTLLGRARALQDEGDFDEAIRLLLEADRAAPADELAIALVGLRHQAGMAGLSNAHGSALAAATAPPPPVGPRGLPEIPAEKLDATLARTAIEAHGTFVVPGALSAPQAAMLVERIDDTFAQAQQAGEARTPGVWSPLKPSEEAAARLEGTNLAIDRKFVHDAAGILLADSPRLLATVLDLYEQVGLRQVVTEYLGGRPLLSANKCTLRRVPTSTIGGWHQDGAFLGPNIGAINIWLALTDCGRDAPGLDIVPVRLDEIVGTGTDGAHFDWSASDGAVTDAAGTGGSIRPEFRAGDMVIFDEMMMHRTAVSPTMTRPRYAIEFWCFRPERYPSGQVPLVW